MIEAKLTPQFVARIIETVLEHGVAVPLLVLCGHKPDAHVLFPINMLFKSGAPSSPSCRRTTSHPARHPSTPATTNQTKPYFQPF